MSWAVGHIDCLARYKDPHTTTVPTKIVRMMRPLDRKTLPTLGVGVRDLSSNALNAAIAFEGTMKLETRRMHEIGFDDPMPTGNKST